MSSSLPAPHEEWYAVNGEASEWENHRRQPIDSVEDVCEKDGVDETCNVGAQRKRHRCDTPSTFSGESVWWARDDDTGASQQYTVGKAVSKDQKYVEESPGSLKGMDQHTPSRICNQLAGPRDFFSSDSMCSVPDGSWPRQHNPSLGPVSFSSGASPQFSFASSTSSTVVSPSLAFVDRVRFGTSGDCPKLQDATAAHSTGDCLHPMTVHPVTAYQSSNRLPLPFSPSVGVSLAPAAPGHPGCDPAPHYSTRGLSASEPLVSSLHEDASVSRQLATAEPSLVGAHVIGCPPSGFALPLTLPHPQVSSHPSASLPFGSLLHGHYSADGYIINNDGSQSRMGPQAPHVFPYSFGPGGISEYGGYLPERSAAHRLDASQGIEAPEKQDACTASSQKMATAIQNGRRSRAASKARKFSARKQRAKRATRPSGATVQSADAMSNVRDKNASGGSDAGARPAVRQKRGRRIEGGAANTKPDIAVDTEERKTSGTWSAPGTTCHTHVGPTFAAHVPSVCASLFYKNIATSPLHMSSPSSSGVLQSPVLVSSHEASPPLGSVSVDASAVEAWTTTQENPGRRSHFFSQPDQYHTLLESFRAFTGSTRPQLPLPIRAAMRENCGPSNTDGAVTEPGCYTPSSAFPLPSTPYLGQIGLRDQHGQPLRTEGNAPNRVTQMTVDGNEGGATCVNEVAAVSMGVEERPSQQSTPSSFLRPTRELPPSSSFHVPATHVSAPACYQSAAAHYAATPSSACPRRTALPCAEPYFAVPSSAPPLSASTIQAYTPNECRQGPQVPPVEKHAQALTVENSTRRKHLHAPRYRPISSFASSLLGALATVEWRTGVAGQRLSTKFSYLRCLRTGESLFSTHWKSGCEGLYFDYRKALWRVQHFREGKKKSRGFCPKRLGGLDAAKNVAMLYRIYAAEREDIVRGKLMELALEWRQDVGDAGREGSHRSELELGTSAIMPECPIIPPLPPAATVVEGILRNEAESERDSPSALLQSAMHIVAQMRPSDALGQEEARGSTSVCLRSRPLDVAVGPPR
ncbi:AP2 domain transcription factor AP2XII-3 [Besnoitia besnoiti]|uniref:AP2 domain transcription factor AP2XII-3 n=1 Tax=Besnoitia besnoiti TaxID=94643 RepID=A0A2A9MQ55_BESBE|nr:AP2 domain transcription factor AP2XII-3 [Besnoitia besnoiti]PFH38287.1 AP2 domain transcription factor AP2XII-3 [Besnoitia besnoiti]